MRLTLFTWFLLLSGCEWSADIAPRQKTIEVPTALTIDISGTWIPYNRITRRLDEESSIQISREAGRLHYDISWPDLKQFSVSAVAMELEQNRQYALVDFEITYRETNEETYRVALLHFSDRRLCVWWVTDEKLKKRAEELGLKMDFETCFPLGTTVNCNPEDLRAAILSNPAAVVREPEVFYRKVRAK